MYGLAVVAFIATTAQAQKTNVSESKKGYWIKIYLLKMSKLYGSMVSYTSNNQEIVKLEFDEVIVKIFKDKKTLNSSEEIRNRTDFLQEMRL